MIDSSCSIFKPITRSVNDRLTPQTDGEIDEHNSKWVCRCEDDCPLEP